MHKIQARNIAQDLYARVSAAAESNNRSMEGEVRQMLIEQYPEPGSEKRTLRQQWQYDTAGRLRGLVTQLKADGFWQFRGPGTLVQLARHVGETSPARFLDWLDGSDALSFEAAERISAFTGCSTDWLMDGQLDPFPVADIGSPDDYKAFFSAGGQGDSRYHLIRFSDGTLYFIRHDRQANTWNTGYTGGRFYLANGMGGGGTGNLKSFLQYLKTQGQRLRIDSHDSRESSDGLGQHHPCWFVKDAANTMTDWLPQLLKGDLPVRWTDDAGELRYILSAFRDQEPKKVAAFVQKLAATLGKFDIYSDHWPAFSEGYIKRSPTGKATGDLFLEQLPRVAIVDRLRTLHEDTLEAAVRRCELIAALQVENDFTPDTAAEFVKGISVRFQTPEDFIRALGEQHVHCQDSGGFLDGFTSLQLRDAGVTRYQFPNNLMEVVESQSFIHGDGSIHMDAISHGNLHLLLTRDFRFSDDQAKTFIRGIKVAGENGIA
ncbi:hypothetical protein [Erwinia sp. MYb535]|uniref:hypothetical protein n=1 Tax=Erwinia sp. MYb535 TaxID=2745309 RepID=UPI0030A7273A